MEDIYNSVITIITIFIFFFSEENKRIEEVGRVLSIGYKFLWKLFEFLGSNRLYTYMGLVFFFIIIRG
jgi:hypothetical protein